MSGLSTQVQLSRSGRGLIAELMAGTAQPKVTDFSTPAAGSPAATVFGAPGAAAWTYVVKAVSLVGESFSAASASTSTGNAVLSSTNYNAVTWAAVAGAVSYNVYRTVSGGIPSSLGFIGNTTSLSLNDGQASSSILTGISHVAVGSGAGGSYSSFGTNPRLGNNYEMTGIDPVILHNDFPVYNFASDGVTLAATWYFIEQASTAADLALSFGNNAQGPACLQQNMFNHLFIVHSGTSGSYGLGEIQNVPTPTPVRPASPIHAICYVGYVECDTGAKTFHNPTRMFNELGRVAPSSISFLGDRAINGPTVLELLTPDLMDTSTQPNPSLLVRALFNLGVNDTIREIAVIGNAGKQTISWNVPTFTSITVGQGVFVRAGIAF